MASIPDRHVPPDSPDPAGADSLAARPSWENGAVLVLVLAGALLRLFQFLSGRSLWLDEIMLSRNVLDRGWTELLGTPLDFHQVAPAGFLLLQKLAVTLLGDGELALRTVPLLASFASLFLFWRVARRFLAGWPLLGALGLFAFSAALLWYSSEAKQYSTDVAATLAVLLLALRFHDQRALFWHEARAYLLLRTRKRLAEELHTRRNAVLTQVEELATLHAAA
jgi:predicted membrane-bound mannosyltransferase